MASGLLGAPKFLTQIFPTPFYEAGKKATV
jgi:hypothetical protein